MADGRVQIQFRAYPQSMVWFDQLGTEYEANRSEVLRAALFVAKQHPEEMAKTLKAIKEMHG